MTRERLESGGRLMFVCRACSAMFPSEAAASRHEEMRHPGLRPRTIRDRLLRR